VVAHEACGNARCRICAIRSRAAAKLLEHKADTKFAWVNDPAAPSLWHTQRAKAERERWDRLRECGTKQIQVACAACGECEREPRIEHCDHWRLCGPCRKRRMLRCQAKFMRGRSALLARRKRDTSKWAKGGRWSEKLITLTVPHSGDVRRDVHALKRAWPRFKRRLAAYLKRRGCQRWREIPYWRATEITHSDDGHAHYHVWVLAPYIPRVLLGHWWALSLDDEWRAACVTITASEARAYSPGDAAEITRNAKHGMIYTSIVDVRAADSKAAGELIKYMVKDAEWNEGARTPIAPETFAKIYAATTGLRARTTSIHWWVERNEVQPCECGSCTRTAVRLRHPQRPIYSGAHGPPPVPIAA
jgi:hypothetical protein